MRVVLNVPRKGGLLSRETLGRAGTCLAASFVDRFVELWTARYHVSMDGVYAIKSNSSPNYTILLASAPCIVDMVNVRMTTNSCHYSEHGFLYASVCTCK